MISPEMIKTIFIALIVAVALIGFAVGFARAFSRLSWGALIWGLTIGGWVLFEKFFHEYNPILKMDMLADSVKDGVASLSVLVASAAITLLGFGIMHAFLRPKKRRRNAPVVVQTSPCPYGATTPAPSFDEKVEDEKHAGVDVKPAKRTAPNLVDRVLGGIFGAVEGALVLFGIAAILLVVLGATSSVQQTLAEVVKLDGKLMNTVRTYALDITLLAIILAFGALGMRVGMIKGVLALKGVALGVAAIAAAAVPFLPLGFIAKFDAFVLAFINVHFSKVEILATIGPYIPKAVLILICEIIFIAVVLIVFALIEALQASRRNNVVVRVLDGLVGTVVFLAIGLLVCGLVLFTMYFIQGYITIKGFNVTLLYNEHSAIVTSFNAAMDKWVKPFIEQWVKPALDKLKEPPATEPPAGGAEGTCKMLAALLG